MMSLTVATTSQSNGVNRLTLAQQLQDCIYKITSQNMTNHVLLNQRQRQSITDAYVYKHDTWYARFVTRFLVCMPIRKYSTAQYRVYESIVYTIS